jgi:hypothetical protein
MATRKETADALTSMVVMHWSKKGYSSFVQQGVNRRGRLRADVVSLHLRGHVVITEVKSCRADFVSDRKYTGYAPYCDQLFMAWPNDFGLELPPGVGLLLPNTVGHLKHARSAAVNKMSGTLRRMLITRLAWKAGPYSKRTTVRKRIYLDKL